MINSIVFVASVLAGVIIVGQVIGRIFRRTGIAVEYSSDDDTWRVVKEHDE